MKEFLKKHNILDHKIAIGVSGGADSLSLAVWAAENSKVANVQIVALTVDHKLRPESTDEAMYVAKIMKKYGIEHHILTWEGEKPDTGIEEAARIARYRLIKQWCYNNDVKSVMVAHHQLDQAETFFMRLHRGSGLDGLCGMSPVSDFEGLKILRPFLQKNPNDLKLFLSSRNIKWVEDSSNLNEDFLRVKIRKFLPLFTEKTGIDISKITKTMETLALSKNYLDFQTAKFIKNHCGFLDDNICSVSTNILSQTHEEIIYRFLVETLKKIGNNAYQPRADDILRLQKNILEDGFSGSTLAGCEIIKYQNKIWIIPEAKNIPMPSREEWKNFLIEHQDFKKRKICGKIRRIVFFNKKAKGSKI